jgi:hypothetical protein
MKQRNVHPRAWRTYGPSNPVSGATRAADRQTRFLKHCASVCDSLGARSTRGARPPASRDDRELSATSTPPRSKIPSHLLTLSRVTPTSPAHPKPPWRLMAFPIAPRARFSRVTRRSDGGRGLSIADAVCPVRWASGWTTAPRGVVRSDRALSASAHRYPWTRGCLYGPDTWLIRRK